jgi:hypothetical protein
VSIYFRTICYQRIVYIYIYIYIYCVCIVVYYICTLLVTLYIILYIDLLYTEYPRPTSFEPKKLQVPVLFPVSVCGPTPHGSQPQPQLGSHPGDDRIMWIIRCLKDMIGWSLAWSLIIWYVVFSKNSLIAFFCLISVGKSARIGYMLQYSNQTSFFDWNGLMFVEDDFEHWLLN